jgi:ribosomal protein S18 acetylase RimI-like enzyme
VIARPWQDVPPEALAALYERERDRWVDILRWDPSHALMEVERARVTWGLPGFVVLDQANALRGYVFYLQTGRRIEVGGITSDSASVTRALVDAVAAAAVAAGIDDVSWFVFEGVPSLREALERHHFIVDPFAYLVRSIDAGTPAIAAQTRLAASPWRAEDAEPVACLLERAYASGTHGRFLPAHTPEDWVHYVRNLGRFDGCGTLHPLATRLLRAGREVKAALLATMVAPETAHIAQLAVDEDLRRRGIATALIADAAAAAARGGATTLTLLVDASNDAARALYARLGFETRATFLAATRPRPSAARVA